MFIVIISRLSLRTLPRSWNDLETHGKYRNVRKYSGTHSFMWFLYLLILNSGLRTLRLLMTHMTRPLMVFTITCTWWLMTFVRLYILGCSCPCNAEFLRPLHLSAFDSHILYSFYNRLWAPRSSLISLYTSLRAHSPSYSLGVSTPFDLSLVAVSLRHCFVFFL